jgi:putative Mg2+ transporter-C (MgtC) family protein
MELVPENPWFINEFQMLLRLLLAVLLGGLIGFEREQANHSAGLRTHILVCLGSCLLMLLSIYGFSDFVDEVNVRIDPARLAAAVITGIGFLGAGTIIYTGKSVSGLTTAASVWVVMAIGLAVGAGFYFAAVASTVILFLVLWAVSKLEKRYINGKKQQLFKIQADNESALLMPLSKLLLEKNVVIRKISVYEHRDNFQSKPQQILQLLLTLPKTEIPVQVVEYIQRMPGVHSVSME